MSDLVTCTVTDGIAHVRLNRPEKKNAQSEDMLDVPRTLYDSIRAVEPASLVPSLHDEMQSERYRLPPITSSRGLQPVRPTIALENFVKIARQILGAAYRCFSRHGVQRTGELARERQFAGRRGGGGLAAGLVAGQPLGLGPELLA